LNQIHTLKKSKKGFYLILAFLFLSVSIFFFENTINNWDVNITYYFNTHRIAELDKTVNFISNLATPMIIVSIALLLFYHRISKEQLYLNVAKKMLFSFALCASLTFISKIIIHRERPFKVNSEIQKLGSGGSYSFPSGHTADAFVLFFTLPLAFPYNKKVAFLIGLWAMFISYSRLYLGVHYITDIIASILLAKLAVEIAAHFIQKKVSSKTE
jgi:undecaprenyl-diphosphatase